LILQPIVDLVSICATQGIIDAVLSPGSRCAPLTLAFARHPKINVKTISDERAAAFIAMGIAQQQETPTVLVCTSGSAAYNYAPAVAEAFFQQIPLLVLTADRPPEWIDQWDGQTIRQQEIFGKHVKASYQFPDDFDHADKAWHAHRIVREAIMLAQEVPMGPVHINIPLREPFYPSKDESFVFEEMDTFEVLIGQHLLSDSQARHLQSTLASYQKILILCGQQRPSLEIQQVLEKIIESKNAVVVTDTISNCQVKGSVCFHDHFSSMPSLSDILQPDLIISFGKSIISKNLKLFLRKSKATHWHVSPSGYAPDTFQKLSKVIRAEIPDIIKLVNQGKELDSTFLDAWTFTDQLIATEIPKLLNQAAFGEFQALQQVLKEIPKNSIIHVANSMSVRYLNFLGPRPQEIVANRGTSGIDGSNSTAVGCAFTTEKYVTLLTGDMAFFYDRNAFWHNYPMPNLRIVVFNNHAGGIFRLIDGPANQPELEEFFETRQQLDAKNLCEEFGFDYRPVMDGPTLEEGLQDFFSESHTPRLLEIFSDSGKNAAILKEIKGKIKELIGE
jgi:2-succinyl-5-enolpyruvyl-6-hydroxy-3-cyclohexene-1-carboxylate synthase